MKLLNNYFKSKVFIYKSGVLTPTVSRKDGKRKNAFEKVFLPLVIVAREHYQVHERTYPIADKSDVKNIVDNQFQSLKMVHVKSSELTSTSVRIFTFEDSFLDFAKNNLCIFLPETILCRFLEDGQLTTVDRLGSKINLIVKSQNLYSAPSTGLYEDPDMFLLSSGIGECSSKVNLTQKDYFRKLHDEIFKIRFSELPTILRGQIAHQKIIKSLHFPSIITGLLASILVYWGLLWGGLQLHDAASDNDSVREDVRVVLNAKRTLSDLVASAHEQNLAQSTVLSSHQAWEIITQLLENEISIGSFAFEENEMKFELIAVSSTDAIELLQNSTNVSSVNIEGDIYEMYGKQQFKVNVLINASDTDV